jgi:hypothetical protein
MAVWRFAPLRFALRKSTLRRFALRRLARDEASEGAASALLDASEGGEERAPGP